MSAYNNKVAHIQPIIMGAILSAQNGLNPAIRAAQQANQQAVQPANQPAAQAANQPAAQAPTTPQPQAGQQPKKYKPPNVTEPPSVVRERFKALLAKSPQQTQQEVVDRFKGIMVRQKPPVAGMGKMLIIGAIVLFCVIGIIAIWWWKNRKEEPLEPSKGSKAHEKHREDRKEDRREENREDRRDRIDDRRSPARNERREDTRREDTRREDTRREDTRREDTRREDRSSPKRETTRETRREDRASPARSERREEVRREAKKSPTSVLRDDRSKARTLGR